ncbi:hypothetical protein [Streptomyces cirratus]|uniref:hypothetical protein n=1 Tax=Streptomyces cirratus TaxID=68187 RepID=UPI0036103F15
MIEVGQQGAFSVNSVGLERRPFPLSFGIREAEGVWQVRAGAAQAGALVDLLMAVANDTVAVVSLETNSYLDEDWHALRPSLIAAELGVPCRVHPSDPGRPARTDSRMSSLCSTATSCPDSSTARGRRTS